jgi:hypothetical protein
MSSKTERILAAIEALLAGTTGVGSRIYRDRWEPLARNELPALVIQPESEDDETDAMPYTRCSLRVNIDILVSGSKLSTLSDPIRVSLHQKLLADRSLGGLAIDIERNGASWDANSGEIGALRLKYLVKFRTRTNDLTQ